MIFPSVLPTVRLRAPLGFHRFEPVEWNGIAPAPGNVTYPTRNFATLGPFMIVAPELAFRGSVISAELSMSPWRSDYIIANMIIRVWRVVSEDSRTARP